MDLIDKVTCDDCLKELTDVFPEDNYFIHKLKVKLKGWNLCEPCAKKRYTDQIIKGAVSEPVEKISCNACHKELNDDCPVDTEYTNKLKLKFDDWHLCRDCAKKRYTEERISEYTGVIQAFSKLVNNCAFDHDGVESDAIVTAFFKEHRQLQNDMISSLHRIFAKIGSHEGDLSYEDPRNQWALSWCNKVSKIY